MATLITGGTGFLGSYLTRHIVQAQPSERVVVLDNRVDRGRIADVLDRVNVIEGDVTDLNTVRTAIESYDVSHVAHFAFVLGGPAPGKAVPWVAVQSLGMANVLEAARAAGVKRVLFGSSVAAYGRPNVDILTEDLVPEPADIYGDSKVWGESLARHFTRFLGLDTVVLRFGSTYGLGRAWRGSYDSGLMTPPPDVHYMARVEDAARGKPIVLPHEDAMADWLYAADAARATWLALTAEHPPHHLYNVGSERRSVGDFARALRKVLPDVPITLSATEMPGHAHLAMSTRRLREDLGFAPAYTLEDGLRDYIDRIRAYDQFNHAQTVQITRGASR
ncbi:MULTISPECIES: NAD(P)-dependent oxidoreductase [unclassified Pseudofrankia]|uniref:NAD-dependent epimerase/dehydratase family protein n=1 Tax=unclassified Pseudofrankia TaxID=2994372 RepID=UPI0008DA9473|nr:MULTISPECIES: NAD(P)-dependent oxidoreductase [unclassified Pseudofrankia]MDT3445779.1 NAD(P)-dependent oxidoreductase [Pseudofrankia sp. BMG5.37]OHV62786.1 hypothetical protein BCD48_39140 [Pseudofrankia sp. BMG5.36]